MASEDKINKVKINRDTIIYLPIAIVIILIGILFFVKINTEIEAINADYIIRISYTGLENLFHDKYEYYAISNNKATNISSYIKEHSDYDIESYDKYKDTDTNYWFIRAISQGPELDRIYSNIELNSRDVVYDIDGCTFKVVCSTLTRNTRKMSDTEENIFKPIIKSNMDQITDNQFEIAGIESFEVVNKEGTDTYIICDSTDTLYSITNNGELKIEIMRVPENGDFDYIYWTKIA